MLRSLLPTLSLVCLGHGTAVAQAPQVFVWKTATQANLLIRHPHALTSIDWSTFRFLVNGRDFTGVLASFLGTPRVQVTPNKDYVHIGIGFDLRSLAIGARVCARNGECGAYARRLRAGIPPQPNQLSRTLPSYNQMSLWGRYEYTASYLDVPTTTVLTGFSGIGNAQGVPNWPILYWNVNVWRAGTGTTLEQEFAKSPTRGNQASYVLDVTRKPAGFDYRIDMVPRAPIVLPPGRYLISCSPGRAFWFWRESPYRLGADVRADSAARGQWFSYGNFGYPTGSAAIDFLGY